MTGTYIGLGTANAGEFGGNIALDSQGNIYITGQLSNSEPASVYFDTNPIQPYPAAPNFVYDPFLVVFNPSATSILMGTMLGGNNADTTFIGCYNGTLQFLAGKSLIVEPDGTIWMCGSGDNETLASFQSALNANGVPNTVYLSNTSNTEYRWLAKIAAVSPQSFAQDQGEPNDTSDLPFSLESYQTTNPLGQTTWGPLPNLTTVRHVGGPVGDGLNYNGLFDYDWYQVIPPSHGADRQRQQRLDFCQWRQSTPE